jgi:hypothetical protein
LALARQFHGEPDDARLFGGRQLLDFVNDGGCSHAQKILEIPPHSNAFFKCFRLHRVSARQGGFWFQLKSQKSRLGESITDGAILKVEG